VRKDKILFFIDKDWIHFGIAKLLQEKFDCELYAIIDLDKTSCEFFNLQKIVNFKKVWFYQNFIRPIIDSPDISFLQSFEKKFNLNLWEIALSERFFTHYNNFYKFQYSEILSILERECKLFEKILEDIKPDFLIIKLTDSHQSHLLHQLCRNSKIKTLMLGWTRFGYRCSIYDQYDKFDKTQISITKKERTSKELKNYLKNYHSSNAATQMITQRKSFLTRFKKFINFLLLLGKYDVRTYYPHYGKNWFNILTRFIFIKKWKRKNFLDKFSIKTINSTKNVYFPLHVEPERSLLLVAPYYTNQIQVIKNIAKSLPIDYTLYVKEHRAMGNFGWRKISYYQKIMDLPNVKLIHPNVDSEYVQQKCSLTITIGGASGLEAAFYDKPTIVFANVGYSELSSVEKVNDINELPKIIRKMIDTKIDNLSLNNYVDLVEENTFEIDLISIILDFENYFTNEFSTLRSNIDPSKMSSFIEKHRAEFELLADEHIKKINFYKNSIH